MIDSFFFPYDFSSGSEITSCTSGLQMFGKRYDVHNNVVYIMTKL